MSDINKMWISEQEMMLRNQFLAEQEAAFGRMLWGLPPIDNRTEEQKYIDDIKYAYVIVQGKRLMVGVHNKDMKAYALNEYSSKASEVYEVKEPLEQIIYSDFERWCTSMDL